MWLTIILTTYYRFEPKEMNSMQLLNSKFQWPYGTRWRLSKSESCKSNFFNFIVLAFSKQFIVLSSLLFSVRYKQIILVETSQLFFCVTYFFCKEQCIILNVTENDGNSVYPSTQPTVIWWLYLLILGCIAFKTR